VPGEKAFQIIASRSRTPSDLSQSQQILALPNYTTPPLPLNELFDFEAFVWNLENAVPPTISLAPECEAVPFFFKNFITLPQQAESTRGYLEYLVPLYNRARPSSVLHLATTAVAMATCGQYPGRQQLLREAVSTYGKAIKKLNDDLKDPVMARSDETVLAILIFSLYEVSQVPNSLKHNYRANELQTIMSTDDTITAWGNHVDGAVALTKLRGMDQFNDPMSHAMFRAVRTMMVRTNVPCTAPHALTKIDHKLRPALETHRVFPWHRRLGRPRRHLRRKCCQPADPHLHRPPKPTRPCEFPHDHTL
jgi:hypothetical protein